MLYGAVTLRILQDCKREWFGKKDIHLAPSKIGSLSSDDQASAAVSSQLKFGREEE
jgi:hypothetical protein